MAVPIQAPAGPLPFALGLDDLQGIAPTFFIGLGGSGGRVVSTLARRLQREPAWDKFKSLIHFVCADTDQNDMDRLRRHVDVANLCTMHKGGRIALARGEKGLPADHRIASWVHPWYGFRDTDACAGAGQIRLESRFSLHCHISDGHPRNFRDIVQSRLTQSLHAQQPNRAVASKVRFYLYGSLAGGTGSGASLVVAYLLRRLARDAGAQHEIYGTFFLPSLFRDTVAAALHTKINANSYAALKEIDAFMANRFHSLKERREFVHDPKRAPPGRVAADDHVSEEPFDWVYLVDRPEGMSVEQIYQAAGEAAFLQLFTPILGFQDREKNNFDQIQDSPAYGLFPQQYGSMGASVLEFPRERLICYLARRKTVELLRRYVVGQATATADTPDAWT